MKVSVQELISEYKRLRAQAVNGTVCSIAGQAAFWYQFHGSIQLLEIYVIPTRDAYRLQPGESPHRYIEYIPCWRLPGDLFFPDLNGGQ